MASISPQKNPQQVHLHQIDELATELECDESLVAEVYWNVLDRLERSSRLKEFVPVFAARQTRDRLKAARVKPH